MPNTIRGATPYSVVQATNEIRAYRQEYQAGRMWANQAITTSTSTSVARIPTYVVTHQPQQEKQMNTPIFVERHSTVENEHFNTVGYHLWVETVHPLTNLSVQSEKVYVTRADVDSDVHNVVWRVLKFRTQHALFIEGVCHEPSLHEDTVAAIQIAPSSTVEESIVQWRGRCLFLDGQSSQVFAYCTSDEYQDSTTCNAIRDMVTEHILHQARQWQSTTLNTVRHGSVEEIKQQATISIAIMRAGSVDMFPVIRAKPPKQYMKYKPLPSHQKLFYDAALYSPASMIDTANRAIGIVSKERGWFKREVEASPIHPAISQALHLAPADDWHQLLLEWPHMSDTDKSKIAYTRDERAGMADKQTVTSVGKYIRRHFTALPDHEVRTIASSYVADECRFFHTIEEMVQQVQQGATSCMNWSSAAPAEHPYNVYDPKYGWHMAVRFEGSKPMGRALCMTDPDSGDKFFVRSYRRVEQGYSPADETLQAWLTNQGYEKRSGWEGCTFKYISRYSSFLAPYLDGNAQNVTMRSWRGETTLVVDEEGEYICNNTDGTPDAQENRSTCENCDDYFDEGDGYWVGRQEDVHVCSSCFDHHYVSALGRNGAEYYTNSDNTVWVESQDMHFHQDYLSDNGIIQLCDGDYEHMDECVFIERHHDWYHNDDSAIQYCERADEYELHDECEQLTDDTWAHSEDVWCCAHSGEFYMLEDKQRERHTASDGKFVYVDYLEEYEQSLADNAANQTEVI